MSRALRWWRSRPRIAVPLAILAALPVAIVLFSLFGPVQTDAFHHYGGVTIDQPAPFALGEPTIDPNFGVTAQALGMRAARDVVAGRLPLWNHHQGFGAPLLGEMQSAALFPPTWLQALPDGQTLEQAFLQGLGGLGAFLFFRRFGVGIGAALVGGIAFEVNGVFAWLRNAIFNPVAFLPWLFLVVEGLYVEALAGADWRRRMPFVALGAVAAALALYAGFPEEVYLYGLLLVVWTIFRGLSLRAGQIGRFLGDLLATGLLALLLSAPLLVAFIEYLAVAELGGHAGEGFGGVSLPPAAMLHYLSPYVFGRIFWSPDPVVADLWSSTGGYIGFVPVVLGIAALLSPGRRGAKLVLAGWVFVAVGVTQGLPGLQQAFTLIPLTKAAAVFRYLNTGWIFCVIALAVLFLDAAPRMEPKILRRRLLGAVLIGLVAVGVCAAAAWPLVSSLFAASPQERRPLIVGLASLLGLAALLGAATLARRPTRVAAGLGTVLLIEAVVWFAVPYQSYPRRAKLDLDLLAFLRDNAAYQRVMNTLEAGISTNYGSAFGFSQFDYDDLPSPKLSAAYIKARIDPDANSIAYSPYGEGLSPEQRAERAKRLRARLAAFASAGVKYVLGGREFDLVAPYDLGAPSPATRALAPGEAITLRGRAGPHAGFTVSAVAVRVDPAERAWSGVLTATLCVSGACADGRLPLDETPGMERLRVPLGQALTLAAGSDYEIRISREGGDGRLAIPLFEVVPGEGAPSLAGVDAPPGVVPDLKLKDDGVSLAYSGRTMSVYELAGSRGYVTAPGCRLTLLSHDRIDAACERPSRLTRLELSMAGWSATIDGGSVPIGIEDGLFQTLDLPAGASSVLFTYRPRGFELAGVGTVFAVLVLGIGVAYSRRPHGGRRPLPAGTASFQQSDEAWFEP